MILSATSSRLTPGGRDPCAGRSSKVIAICNGIVCFSETLACARAAPVMAIAKIRFLITQGRRIRKLVVLLRFVAVACRIRRGFGGSRLQFPALNIADERTV